MAAQGASPAYQGCAISAAPLFDARRNAAALTETRTTTGYSSNTLKPAQTLYPSFLRAPIWKSSAVRR
jgi:hypothetical protein